MNVTSRNLLCSSHHLLENLFKYFDKGKGKTSWLFKNKKKTLKTTKMLFAPFDLIIMCACIYDTLCGLS